ncbi:MAG TPA: hypothetical protein V6D48_00960 [Oculatellaceae cyanobacterium]
MTPNSKINPTTLESDAFKLIEEWKESFREKHKEKASELCQEYIDSCKFILKHRPWEDVEDNYNKLLILAILFKGLQDFVGLAWLTEDKDWHENHKYVEYTWITLCDCRDRIEFVSQYCQVDVIELVLRSVYKLEEFFKNAFGDGYYSSPEVLVKKFICNICQQDTRACSHIAGRLYGGKICHYLPIEPCIRAVALVKVPKDPRCRIWSWQLEGNQIHNVCLITSFSIDEFLSEE